MRRRTLLSAALAAALPSLVGCEDLLPARTGRSGTPVRLLLGGDTGFGESYPVAAAGRRPIVETVGYDHSLQGLAPLLRRADYSVVNLETPLTTLRSTPLVGKEYVHWSDFEKAPASLRAHGVNALGLANNHTMDLGLEGLEQTLEAIRRHGLAGFGGGATAAQAAAPLEKMFTTRGGRNVHVAIFGMFEYRKRYDEAHQFYAGPSRGGVNRLAIEQFAEQVAAFRRRAPDGFVIAWPHWGANYAWRTGQQARAGRALVDAGADMVVGHHGHVLQEVERYQGKWILYGIGNFMFNAPGRYDEFPDVLPYGLAVDLAFHDEPRSLPVVRLHPILSDNSATNFQPRPGDQAVVERVLGALSRRARPATRERMATASTEVGPCIRLF